MASQAGTVVESTDNLIVLRQSLPDGTEKTVRIPLKSHDESEGSEGADVLVFPTKSSWQKPVVAAGDHVKKKQLLARGVTEIYFQANVWVFAVLAILIGSVWGIGKAAVYKHIPDYFPEEVGVVGGMVGVLGGLGGFICPVVFGYLLEWTGLWTSAWMFIFVLSGLCLLWMHRVIQKMMRQEAPELHRQIESVPDITP
jgi:NNP family nitrate/nitrite transporter-like MFS transporter